MEIIRRALRAILYSWRAFGSKLRIARYRCLYSDLRVGQRVHLSRGVYISVVRGGALQIGDDVHIGPHCHLTAEGSLSIGARSYVGQGTVIVAAHRIEIGSDALVAAYATVRDQDHRRMESGTAYNRQGLVTKPVHIGENVWIGTKATILKGVDIGSDAVIGANSVVTTAVSSGAVVAGIPARPIATG